MSKKSQLTPFIPIWADELKMKPSHRVVYYHLWRRTSRENRIVWPSKETIAQSCDLSVNTVEAALTHLIEARLIEREERPGTSNNYRLLVPAEPTPNFGEANPPQKLVAQAPQKLGPRAPQKLGYKGITMEGKTNERTPMPSPGGDDGGDQASFDKEKIAEEIQSENPDIRPTSVYTALERTEEDMEAGKLIGGQPIRDPKAVAEALARKMEDMLDRL